MEVLGSALWVEKESAIRIKHRICNLYEHLFVCYSGPDKKMVDYNWVMFGSVYASMVGVDINLFFSMFLIPLMAFWSYGGYLSKV